MNWAWSRTLLPTAKLVLMSLADAADDYGVCWPSASTLARKCGISTRTVRRILHELVQCGLIRAEPQFRKDGSRTANRYVMALRRGDKMTPGLAMGDHTPGHGFPGPHDACDIPRTATRPLSESPPLPISTTAREAEATTYLSVGSESGEHTSSFNYPRHLSPSERITAHKMLVPLCPYLAQQVLDELAANLECGVVRGAALTYLRGLVTRAKAGTFVPTQVYGIQKDVKRERRPKLGCARPAEALRQGGDTTQGDQHNVLLDRLAAIRSRSSDQNGNG